MEYFINEDKVWIREDKKEELMSFLKERVNKKDGNLETYLWEFLSLDDVYIEQPGDRLYCSSKGIYEQERWKELAPFLEGYIEWTDRYEEFRDVYENGTYRSITPTIQWENEPIEVLHLKKYLIYLDDGSDAFRVTVPAANIEAAKKYVQRKGEIVAIKDVTEYYIIGLENIRAALADHGFGSTEIELILRTLEFTGVAL